MQASHPFSIATCAARFVNRTRKNGCRARSRFSVDRKFFARKPIAKVLCQPAGGAPHAVVVHRVRADAGNSGRPSLFGTPRSALVTIFPIVRSANSAGAEGERAKKRSFNSVHSRVAISSSIAAAATERIRTLKVYDRRLVALDSRSFPPATASSIALIGCATAASFRTARDLQVGLSGQPFRSYFQLRDLPAANHSKVVVRRWRRVSARLLP